MKNFQVCKELIKAKINESNDSQLANDCKFAVVGYVERGDTFIIFPKYDSALYFCQFYIDICRACDCNWFVDLFYYCDECKVSLHIF